eukprot:3988160-Prymnesium_polylepis.2
MLPPRACLCPRTISDDFCAANDESPLDHCRAGRMHGSPSRWRASGCTAPRLSLCESRPRVTRSAVHAPTRRCRRRSCRRPSASLRPPRCSSRASCPPASPWRSRAAPRRAASCAGVSSPLPHTCPYRTLLKRRSPSCACPMHTASVADAHPPCLRRAQCRARQVFVESLVAHLSAEWLHILEAIGAQLFQRIIPTLLAAARTLLRALWRPLRLLLGALAAALRSAAHILRQVGLTPLRLIRRGLALAHEALALLLRALRAPLRLLFPRALHTVGAVARAAARLMFEHAASFGRALRTACRLGRLLRAPRDAAAAVMSTVKRSWRVALRESPDADAARNPNPPIVIPMPLVIPRAAQLAAKACR